MSEDAPFVETQATSTPHFDEALPRPETPAGQIYFAGAAARRAGPAMLRTLLGGVLLVSVLVLIAELT